MLFFCDSAFWYTQVKYVLDCRIQTCSNKLGRWTIPTPVEATNDTTGEVLRWMAVKDRRKKMSETVRALDMSEENFHILLHDRLGMRKLSTWCEGITKTLGPFTGLLSLQKRRGKVTKVCCLSWQWQSAYLSTCSSRSETQRFRGWPQSSYSADLAPSNYFPFPNMKKGTAWTRFLSNDALKFISTTFWPLSAIGLTVDNVEKGEVRGDGN